MELTSYVSCVDILEADTATVDTEWREDTVEWGDGADNRPSFAPQTLPLPASSPSAFSQALVDQGFFIGSGLTLAQLESIRLVVSTAEFGTTYTWKFAASEEVLLFCVVRIPGVRIVRGSCDSDYTHHPRSVHSYSAGGRQVHRRGDLLRLFFKGLHRAAWRGCITRRFECSR